MTTDRSPHALDVARRLLTNTNGARDAVAAASAMQQACDRVSVNLRRTVGDDGYSALLARALRSTERAHPVLADISRVDSSGLTLNGVGASIDAHGAPVVAAALESLLAALIDILGSLIGADMVLNLIDDEASSGQTPSGKETP